MLACDHLMSWATCCLLQTNTNPPSGVMNITLSFSGPGGAFCAGKAWADVQAAGLGCKAEVRDWWLGGLVAAVWAPGVCVCVCFPGWPDGRHSFSACLHNIDTTHAHS